VGVADPEPVVWGRMLAELDVLGGEGSASWFQSEPPVALARAYRHEPDTADEPPVVEHRECVVVLDGRLAKGAGPGPDSITVSEAYLRWGDECVSHLEGEFTFALWDRHRQRLLCACDPMGRRTLAYHWDGARLLCCSRAVTLLRHPRVPRRLDSLYMTHAVCDMWGQPPGTTPFATVRRLRPGHVLSLDGSRLAARQGSRLRLQPVPEHGSAMATYEAFWSLLDGSMRECLRGTTRPCLLLSGGLDSACIAASAHQVAGSLAAFSVLRRNGRPFLDERRAIEAIVARYPSTRWCELDAASIPPTQLSLKVPLHDDPVLFGAGFPTDLLVRAWKAIADAGFERVLDGGGGDELFDDGMLVGDIVRARAWRTLVAYLARDPSRFVTLRREILAPHLPSFLRRAWRRRARARASPFPSWVSSSFLRRSETARALEQQDAWGSRRTFAELVPAMLESPAAVGTTAALRLLARSTGLDCVSPFLSRSLVEFASGIPAPFRMDPIQGKAFLRHVAKARVPDAVRWRPKRTEIYDQLFREALAIAGGSMPPDALHVAAIGSWVDARCLERSLRQPTPTRRNVQELHAFLAVLAWLGRLDETYGPFEPLDDSPA
jgi:asparagine synthase (glutamine-hydrolysing)